MTSHHNVSRWLIGAAGTIAFVAQISTASANTVAFRDVPITFWGYASITDLAAKGIASGDYNLFEPQQPITRAQFVKFLVTSQDLPLDQTGQTFSDVPTNSWYYPFVEAAFHANIVHGVNPNEFEPDQPLTRQDMVVMLINSLKLSNMNDPLTSLLQQFSDSSGISSYAEQSVSIAAYLGLVNGQYGNFLPLNISTRAQAAAVIDRFLHLDRSKLVQLTALSQPTALDLSSPSNGQAGQPISFAVKVADSAGNTINDNERSIQATVIEPNGTRKVLTSSTQSGIATFSFTPNVSGTYSFSASAAGLQNSASVAVSVTPGAVSSVIPTKADFGSITAGQTVTISSALYDAVGNVVSSDEGRTVTLTETMPNDKSVTISQSDVQGEVAFNISPTLAGDYTLTFSSDGLPDTTAKLHVNAATPAKLNLSLLRSPFIMKGASTPIQVTVEDAYGNATAPSTPVPFTITQSNPLTGTVSIQSTSVANSMQNVGTFTATAVGNTVLTVSTGSGTLQSGTVTATVMANSNPLVSGKGVWLMWRDWHNGDDESMLTRFANAGVTHVYVEVATTSDGFYGQDALDDFLPAAHSHHIAVIGWVYSSLANPAADSTRDISVANYTTPSGDRIDALASDLEENINQSTVDTYGSALKAAVPNLPLIAVTYPPQWRTSYPWQTFGKYFNIMAPMDYWHAYSDRTYTADIVSSFVQTSVTQMQSLTGVATMPVTVIGQGFDLFADSGTGALSPSATEITASMDGAKQSGAVGYSIYRLGTLTDAEWQAFASYKW